MKNLTAFIFARGGSKGLPGKNIRSLAGKPLIGWSIEQAFAVPNINRVIVSTDAQDIAGVARAYGAEVPFMRPAALASDTASELDAWRHALNFLQDTEGYLPSAFVSVPATAPLRLPQDIEACLELYQQEKVDAVITISAAHRNPWFNMVSVCSNGTLSVVNNPDGTIKRRQDAPEVYDITTVAYVADPSFILEGNQIFMGRVRGVTIPVERSLDIDTLHDFEIAEFLMEKRLEST